MPTVLHVNKHGRQVEWGGAKIPSPSPQRLFQNVYFNPSCNWRIGIPKANWLMTPKPW